MYLLSVRLAFFDHLLTDMLPFNDSILLSLVFFWKPILAIDEEYKWKHKHMNSRVGRKRMVGEEGGRKRK